MAERHMMGNRLGGVVQQAVAATMSAKPDSTPWDAASGLLCALEGQLQGRKFINTDDEAGDVLSHFASDTLLHYHGDGLQAVLDHVAAAAKQVDGIAAAAAVRLLRALAAAVGRMAGQPNAEAAREKAAAVMSCLFGMAEALEGATRKPAPARKPLAAASAETASQHRSKAGVAHVPELTAETAAVLMAACDAVDSIAADGLVEGHTVSQSRPPSHPLVSLLEMRMYSETMWQAGTAAVAAGLLESVAAALAHTGAEVHRDQPPAGDVEARARGAAAEALHGMAHAQVTLATTLERHVASPASASRLLAALAEALTSARIAQDALGPRRGLQPITAFGEAQMMLGLSRMAAGVALEQQMSSAREGVVLPAEHSNSSLVLEVLAEQAAAVAQNHKEHITQVLQDLRDVPHSLSALSDLPSAASLESAAKAAAMGTAALLAAEMEAEALLHPEGSGQGQARAPSPK